MKAGKTNIEVGTRIKTTNQWNSAYSVTGKITHPFGCFGGSPLAGIVIDKHLVPRYGEISNLYEGDFDVIDEQSTPEEEPKPKTKPEIIQTEIDKVRESGDFYIMENAPEDFTEDRTPYDELAEHYRKLYYALKNIEEIVDM